MMLTFEILEKMVDDWCPNHGSCWWKCVPEHEDCQWKSLPGTRSAFGNLHPSMMIAGGKFIPEHEERRWITGGVVF